MDKLKETAKCVVCQSPLSDHFDSRNAWIGCNKEAVMKKGHVMFVPVMIFGMSPESAGEMKEVKSLHGGAAESRPVAHDRHPRGSMKLETPQEAQQSHRGRTAGLFLTGEKKPAKTTKSIQAVYDALSKSKRGLTMKAIADKLKMPSGTVGWALRKLRQQDALAYHPL